MQRTWQEGEAPGYRGRLTTIKEAEIGGSQARSGLQLNVPC